MADDPLKAALDLLKQAEQHLELAKSQYESAKASYHSAKTLYQALEISQNKYVEFDQVSALCESCSTIPLLDIFGTNGKPKNQRQKVGDLFDAVERQANCIMCKFLIEAFQIGDETQSETLAASLTPRDTAVYFSQDPDGAPWFQKAGVNTNLEACPFVWLQTGPRTQTGQPHICVTFEPTESSAVDEPKKFVYPRQRDALEAFNGSISYELIHSWLKKCSTQHDHECHQDDTELNLPENMYLIDVEKREVVLRREGMRYAALSYVWGKGVPEEMMLHGPGSMLRNPAWQSMERRLPDNIPQTMEDAITFAKRIEQKYLWIDYFCIDQSVKEKRQAQINAMDQIFASAELTFVAINGRDADWGLPGVSRPLLQSKQPSVKLRSGRLTATFIYSVWDNNGKSIWDSRGWTLQERLLSRRCIMFAKTSLSMQCRTEFFHDSMALDDVSKGSKTWLGDDYFREDGSGINLDQTNWDFSAYDALVSVYSGRHLTFASDALNACQGSLNRMNKKTGMKFYEGLPERELYRGWALLWKAHFDHTLTRRSNFPSFSWLGWSGRSEYPDWLLGIEENTIEKVETNGGSRKRRRRETESTDRSNATVALWSSKDGSSKGIVLNTVVTKFKFRLVRHNGAKHKFLPYGSQQSKTAIGDHWGLLDTAGYLLRNVAGEHPKFESTDVFFRLAASESQVLQDQSCEAEVAFVHFWPTLRDSAGKLLNDMVSALVIVPTKSGEYWRIAQVLLEAEEWDCRNTETRSLKLV